MTAAVRRMDAEGLLALVGTPEARSELSRTLALLESFIADPERNELATVELRMHSVRDLHEFVDRVGKVCEHVRKELVEPAVWEAYLHAEDSLDGEFRWRSGGSAPATARDNRRLLTIAAGHGVTAEAFAAAAKPFTARQFAELVGLSEARMMEMYGDEFEPGAARKPTLLRER